MKYLFVCFNVNSCFCFGFFFILLIKINFKTQKPIILLKTIQKVCYLKLRIKIIRGALEFNSSTIFLCFVTVTGTWICLKILLFLQPVPNLPNLFSGDLLFKSVRKHFYSVLIVIVSEISLCLKNNKNKQHKIVQICLLKIITDHD